MMKWIMHVCICVGQDPTRVGLLVTPYRVLHAVIAVLLFEAMETLRQVLCHSPSCSSLHPCMPALNAGTHPRYS